MANLASLGNTWSDLLLNSFFRGQIANPPETVYFSLGQAGSATVPVELAVTRTPVKRNRGWVNGTNSDTYPYQSSGTGTNKLNIRNPIDVYCTGLGANEYPNICVMIFDAATAGNLLFVWEPNWTYVANVVNGDVVRIGAGCQTVDTTGGWISELDQMPWLARNSTIGAYVYALLADWLFRGFDSMNSMFGTGSYPNVYLAFWDLALNDWAAIPRLGIPRNTSAWTAPVNGAASTLERKISNAVDFTFGQCTAGIANHACRLQVHMASTPQAVNDTIYTISGFNITANVGDSVEFLAGELEIVLN